MSIKFDFKDAGVVVTGGAQGIGFQIVKDFLSAGAKVALWDYSADALAHAKQELAPYSENVSCRKVDITNYAECQAAADALQGPIRVLINNAGITRDRSFTKMEVSEIDQVIQTNLNGALYVTKSLIGRFDDSKQGRIINISSVVGRLGNFGQVNYAASKAGLLGMTASLAKELGRKGITVNAIAPGFIETSMSANIPEDIQEKMRQLSSVQRFGTTGEISAACRFLASEEAAFINGATLAVDGGLSL